MIHLNQKQNEFYPYNYMTDQIYSIFQKSGGVSTDSRKIRENDLFFALKGPNFDANRFAAMAIDSGAIAAVIDEKAYEIPGKTIVVEDTLVALQELARHHRRMLKIPFIGLTGSNGKTTTKELIYEVLRKKFNAIATTGNLNNHIGVPLSVLSVNHGHEIAVIEMGANHIGEIAELSAICQPTHGLITNIGKAHMGLFGGYEGVIRAKSELYDYLIKNKGVIFVNQSQDVLMNMSRRMQEPVFYPHADGYYHCEITDSEPFLKVKTETGRIFETQLIGRYNFDNIATALCIAKYFEVPENDAIDAISAYAPSNNRSQIIKKGSNTIILDAYNANPSSMEKAIETLAQTNGKKVAILGDMYELGDDTKVEHEAVGTLLEKFGIDEIILCGEYMKYAGDRLGSRGFYASKKELLKDYLKTAGIEDSTILIKASRGMALEEVVEWL